ncbi:hypothetical protein RUND412_003610 [Rhizina undulata]
MVMVMVTKKVKRAEEEEEEKEEEEEEEKMIELPAYTLLYHARKNSELPPSPEWLAFDTEMSYGIMGMWGETYMLTFTSTRPLNVLYFDGQSAALGVGGTLDSQKAFLYGKVIDDDDPHGPRRGGSGRNYPGYMLWGEHERAGDLCNWAKSLGEGVVEGFVRMNSGFELLWCDFNTGLELVANRNITVPSDGPIVTPHPPLLELSQSRALGGERPPPPDDGHHPSMPYFPRGPISPFYAYAHWEWIRSATWHYSDTPESRVNLNFCSLETYYDPTLTSLLPRPLSKRQHRLKSISAADAETLKRRLSTNLKSAATSAACSGIDWRRLAESILERYAGRIKELQLLVLDRGQTKDAEEKTAKKVLGLTHAMVMPFMEYDSDGNGIVEEAEERCRLEYTGKIPLSALSPSEELLKKSLEDVMGRICRLALGIYSEAEKIVNDKETGAAEIGIAEKGIEWERRVGEFMSWLDWSGWTRCEDKCGWDEVCAIPLWPVLGSGPWAKPGEEQEHWLEHPKCINMSYTEGDMKRMSGPPPGGRPPLY